MHMNPALQLFGAGREKRIDAVPPYTAVESLGFEDHPFEVQKWDSACALCGATDSFLDEVITDDAGARMHVCSDSDAPSIPPGGTSRTGAIRGCRMSAYIRQAIEADLPSVLALYAQPDLDNGQVLSEDEARAVFAQFAHYPDYRLFVALRDDRAVGTYACWSRTTWHTVARLPPLPKTWWSTVPARVRA